MARTRPRMVLALLLPTTAATNCSAALATRCLLERCAPAGCGQCDRECGGSAGTIGRGWGAAGEGAAFGGTESCLLGVGTDHANPRGFRISVRRWAQGATITWSFETPVKLKKLWGPVSSPADAPDASVLSFELKEPPPPRQARANGRTDQWGFVLAAPYNGKWRVDCKGVSAPPSPPDPPMPAALAAPVQQAVVEEEEEAAEEGEAPAEEEEEEGRGKWGGGRRAKARRRRRQRRRRKKARGTKDDQEEKE